MLDPRELLGNLPNPFAPAPPVQPPWVTPPKPPIEPPPGFTPPPAPPNPFITPNTGPNTPSPTDQGTFTGANVPAGNIDLLPEEIKQRLIDAGFDEQGASTILGIASTKEMSPERIRELLKTKTPYGETPDPAKEQALYQKMFNALLDPRLKDEYTRGLTGITGSTGPRSPSPRDEYVAGQYSPDTRDIELFQAGHPDMHKHLAHELGHHVAQVAMGNVYMPGGWAKAIELDNEKMRGNGPPYGPFVSPYAKRGQNMGAAISEDFADSAAYYFSDDAEFRKYFRTHYPARSAILDALNYAMVNPEKEAARFGFEVDAGQATDPTTGVQRPLDEMVGSTAAARKLSTLAGQKVGAPAFSFDDQVTNPDIKEALESAKRGYISVADVEANQLRPGGGGAPQGGGQASAGVSAYLPLIKQKANKYSIPWQILAGLVDFESGGNPNAGNPSGATGLGQVVPMRGRPSREQLLDPETNLEWSAKILSENINKWGSVDQGLAAYLGAIDGQGNITNAKDSNGTDGPTYVRNVRARAANYLDGAPTGQTFTGFQLINPKGKVITKMGQPIFSFPDKAGHRGIDIAADPEDPIFSPVKGKIVDPRQYGLSAGYGKAVAILDDANRLHIFGHTSAGSVLQIGSEVTPGTHIANVEDVRNKSPQEASASTHTHYEIRQGGDYGKQINPEEFLSNVSGRPDASYRGTTMSPAVRDMTGLYRAGQEADSVLSVLQGISKDPSNGFDVAAEAERLFQSLGMGGQPVPNQNYFPGLSPGGKSTQPVTISTKGGKAAKDMAGAPADVLQAYFQMLLTLSQQATQNVAAQGYTPQMIWDPHAYNGVGGFVPTGNAVESMALVMNRYNTNRAQISALATIAAQSGMVPQVGLDEKGYLHQQYDPMTGQPLYNETDTSKSRRQSAGQAVGFVSRDLQVAPQHFEGQYRGTAPGADLMEGSKPLGISEQAPPAPPAGPEAAPPAAPPPGPNDQGSLVNPAIAAGQPVYSNPQTGLQYPSGQGQGSAYGLNPADMGTPENQDWLSQHPFVPPPPPPPLVEALPQTAEGIDENAT